MDATNVLFIMSDEHNPRMMGCAGHPLVKTPNLDRLAERGTRFTANYTTNPICVPARTSFATGRYTHDIGYWDNALAYDGKVRGWGHRLQDEGIRVESIGKLHYVNETDPTGFDRQQIPMHIMDGIGQVWGSVRDPLPESPPSPPGARPGGGIIGKAGPGESNYNRYDQNIGELTCEWLRDVAKTGDGKPWVLYAGFVAPHFPLIVPQEFFDLYPLADLEMPKLLPSDGHAWHPWIAARPRMSRPDGDGVDEEVTRRALAAYLGLCTFVDAQIGRVLDTLEECGLSDNTRIVYTSDHGDNAGTRGLWGKGNFYEESGGIPLILAGPDIPKGETNNTATTLIDAYQTILQATGLNPQDAEENLPGHSWLDLLGTDDAERTAFSEYHAVGSPSAGFMLRDRKFKYHYYVGFEPELFDIQSDPQETTNLAADPSHADILAGYHNRLCQMLDPEAVDRRAKDDQNALIERFGGREAALNTGTPGASPPPGTKPE